jgi:hypothetical protein
MKPAFLAIALIVVLAWAPGRSVAQDEPQLSGQQETSLKAFLRDYVRNPGYDYTRTRYVAAPVQLEDNTTDIIVYFTDRQSCGTSGCTVLILAPQGSSYKVITSIPAARLPIRVLDTSKHGWRDIGVWVQGGGIQPGYEAALSFNGTTYHVNPSVAPARKLQYTEGRVLIDRGEEGKFLY